MPLARRDVIPLTGGAGEKEVTSKSWERFLTQLSVAFGALPVC